MVPETLRKPAVAVTSVREPCLLEQKGAAGSFGTILNFKCTAEPHLIFSQIILLGWCLFAVSYLHPPRPPIESCDLPTKCVDEESTAIVPASVVRANGLQRLNAMGFQFQKQRLAIVMPFIASQVLFGALVSRCASILFSACVAQIDRLTSNMKLWEPYRACQLTENGERVINTVEVSLLQPWYSAEALGCAFAGADGPSVLLRQGPRNGACAGGRQAD